FSRYTNRKGRRYRLRKSKPQITEAGALNDAHVIPSEARNLTVGVAITLTELCDARVCGRSLASARDDGDHFSGFTGKCLFLRFSGTHLVCSASIFSVASFSAS